MSTGKGILSSYSAAMREKTGKDLISDRNNMRSTAQRTLTLITTRKRRGRPVTDPDRMRERTAGLSVEACNEGTVTKNTL